MSIARTIVLVASVACAAAVIPAQARNPERTWANSFDLDESADKRDFDLPAISGYLKFRRTYRASTDQDFVIRLRSRIPLRFYCMRVDDFDFALTGAGDATYTTAKALVGGGDPHILGPVLLWGGSCPYQALHDALFPLPIDELYPGLRPGEYHLRVTFHPKDGSVSPTRLPEITFRIV